MYRLSLSPLTGITLWFVVIIAVYATAIAVLRPEVNVDRQEQRIKNQIRAERYLYSDMHYDYVIAGSSMTARLPEAALGDSFYKLSFGGGSAIEGMEIVLESDKLPEVLVVEINTLAKPPLDSLVKNLFEPGSRELKQYFPFLRTEYRPASLLVSMLVSDNPHTRVHDAGKDKDTDVAKLKVLENNIRRSEIDGDRSPEEPLLTNNLDRAENLVRLLREKGVTIMFLEMPINSRVAATRYRREIVQNARSRFPAEQYDWIVPSDAHDYMTTDGVHLTVQEAWRAAEYIGRQVRATSNRSP